MKQKIKRHYRSAISILLTICMLISCMTVGLIATDAAKVTEDEVVGKSVSSVTFRVFTKNNSGSEQASATMTAANTEVNLTVPSSSTYYSVRVDVTYSDNSTAQYYQDANNGSDYSIPEWGWYKTSRSGYFQYGAKFPSKNLKIYYQNLADSQVQVHVVKRPDNVNLTVNSVSNATATVTQGSAVATAGGSAVSMAAGSNATLDVAVTNNATHKVTAASYTSDDSTTSISLSNDGNGNYTGTFKVPTADTTVSVTVEERVFYTVTLTSPTNGTLTASKNSCEQGDEVVVTAEPEEGYRLASLTYTPADGSPIDIKSAKKFRMPGKNVTVTAEYVEKQTGGFTFEAKGTGSGVISAGKQYGGTTNMISETVTSPAAQAALPDGTKVNLCAIPDVDSIFEGWYEDDSCTGSPLSTEKDVTVTIGEDPYTWYAKFTSLSDSGYTNVYFSDEINNSYKLYVWKGSGGGDNEYYGGWNNTLNPTIGSLPEVAIDGKTYHKMSVPDSWVGDKTLKYIVHDNGTGKSGNKGGFSAGSTHYVDKEYIETTYADNWEVYYPVHLGISGTSYGDTGVVAYAQAGDQVAVIATSNDVSKAANVTCTDGSSGSVTVTNKRFTMPASEANVVVTYTDVETVVLTYNTVGVGTLTVRCNGKEIESGARIAKDSNVDFIAAPGTGYAFSSWSGSGDKPTGSAESVSKKITQNTNVIATFSQVSYKVVTSPNTNSPSKKDMKTLDNGYVRSVKKITTTGAWFTIKNEANSTYASSFKDGTDASTHYAQEVSDSKPGYPYSWETTTPVKHVFKSGITGYVFYDPATGKIWMSDDPDGATGVTVIAKDGSFTDANGGADTNSQRYGKTTLKINGSADGVDNAYNKNAKKYTGLTADDVEEGTTEITVTTTVDNSYKDAFKVVAFDVNGQTFYPEVSSGPSYTTTFKLSDITVNTAGYIEITPIYFLKDDSKTTRFYARNFSGDVKSRWGGTLYCYPFGMSSHSDEFTNWPGQPMINLGGGTYYVDVPSTTKAISLSNAAADWVHATTMGIVLDDRNSDTWVNRNHYQCQSYDYDDFRYIQELLTANGMSDEDIIFDFKFKEGKKKATGKDNFPTLWNDNDNTSQTKYKNFPSTISASDMASNFSFWEDYTDFYGKNIDLWGNKITVNADVKNPVRVISQGYTDATTYSPNAGRYATAFIVYKPDDWYSDNPTYSLVPYTAENVYGVRSRSEFLQSLVVDGYSSSDMTAAKAALEHYPVKISYEYSLYECYATDGSQNLTNQYADRCDGVWYYSTSTTTVKAKIKIQYADKKTDKFTDDTFTDVDPAEYDYDGEVFKNNTGETTKASAYFIDKNYSGDYRDPDDENQIRPVDPPLNVSYSNRIKEWAYTDGYDKYDITATEPEDGVYSFIGWWKVSGNTEEFITSDYNYQMEVTNDETFIARYVKTPAGELKLLHNIHTSSEGTGDRLISYTVTKNGNEIPAKTGEVRATTEGETSSLRVPKDYIQYGKGYKITVTFTATPGTNVVNAGLYPTENGTDYLTKSNFETANSVTGFSLTTDSFSTTPTVKATNTETIEIDVDKLFYHGSDYEAGDADHKISLLQIFSAFENNRTVTIKKLLPDFVSDIETGFSVHIQVSDTENGMYSDITGSFTSSISANNGTFTNGKVTIHNGETITFAVDKNKYFTVTEENVSSPYEFNALYLTSDTSTNLGNGYKCLADADKNFEIHNKVFANYTINYTYPSRFNNRTGEMLYDYQTYTVNGKIDSTDENFLNYIDYANSKVNQALVIAKNPFESDFMYNFVWDFDNTVYNPDSQEYTANVTTTTPTMKTVHVTFEFPYDYMDARGAGWTGTSIIYSASSANPARKTYDSPAAILIGYQTVPYALEPYQYFDEDGNTKTGYRIHCTTAPEKCGGKDFLYWSIREKAIGSDDTWVEVARCYTNEYTYATFNDYHVRPIFEGDDDADLTTEQTKSETTIKFLETSRNQWNNNQKGTKSTSYAGQDMVYADFDVAYRYKGQDVDDSTNLKIGVLIENIGTIDQEYLLDHRNTTTAEGKNAYTRSLAHYKDTTYYAYNAEAIKTYLRSVIKDGKSAADAQATYQTAIGEKPYTLNLKQRQPDQTLTNMNRVEYYHGSTVRSIASGATDKVNDWSVNEANTNGVFRAYSYIVDEEGNVTLSEPTYYTLYGTATLDHLTTE